MIWDTATVHQLAETGEIDVVVPAPDRPDVRAPIWIVAVDGDLYVRSWKGEAGRWYRRAHRYGTGSIVADGQTYAVRFTAAAEPALNTRVDEAFLSKYATSPYTPEMVRPPASTTTMRLEPLSPEEAAR